MFNLLYKVSNILCYNVNEMLRYAQLKYQKMNNW